MKLKITILSICLLVFGNLTMAQTSSGTTETTTSSSSSSYGLPKKGDFDHWSIGLTGGANWFQGDLQSNSINNSGITDNIKFPVLGLKIGYQLSHSVQVNLRGHYTKLQGKMEGDDDIEIRLPDAGAGHQYTLYNASFESPVMQGSLNLNYTLGNISFVQRNKRFHFYGELGLGIFSFSPKVRGKIRNSLTDIRPDSLLLERKNITEGMIPVSLGVKYQFGRFDAGLMMTYHKTLTDKIDWIDKPLSESDNYSFVQVSLNYTLGKKQAMMEWVNPMEVVYNDMAELKDKMDVMSGDKDKDGVSDMFDKDNSTAEGSKVYGDGTAVDTDGDGITDSKDGDPFTAKGGKVDANGVEVDTDGDGVPDSRDLEPNTAKGSLVNFQGISIDKSLAAAGKNSVGWLPSVFFSIDRSDIAKPQQDRILVVARVLKSNPDLKLMISGNTDVDAGESYNDKLGLKRAEAVKNHLVKVYGIDAARLSTESKGEKDPMAKNLKAMNRRVDFSVAQ